MDLKQIAAGSMLILILLSLCIYYHDYHESNLKYPSTAAILSQYPEGSTVFISGTALKQNYNGFDLRDDNSWNTRYHIISNKHIKPDDYVQLLGILGQNYTVKSTRTVVETKHGYEFIILRSAIALITFMFIFLWYWKFNFKRFELIRRR